MSNTNRLGAGFEDRDLDVTVAKLGLVASILLLGLRLLAEQVFLVVIPLSIGVACATYLVTHDRVMQGIALPTLSVDVAGYLPALVVASTAGLVAAVRLTGGRSIPILLLTAAIGSLLLVQIFLVDDDALNPPVVLFEILAVAVVVRLTALYAVPGFVGGDIWVHGPVWIDGIAASGSFEPIADSKYLLAPLYHALGALGALVTGSVRSGIYLTVGVVVPLSAVFVYGIGSLFVPARWALTATALFAFADQFIRWGIHLIPTSLGLAFFLATFYLALKVLYANADRWTVVGLFAFSLAVVFTHQVSTAIMLVTLGVAVFVTVLVDAYRGSGWRRATTVLVVAFVVSTVATAVSWLLAPWSGGGAAGSEHGFLVEILGVIAETFSGAGFLQLKSAGDGGGGGGSPVEQSLVSELIPYVELFGFALLLAAAVVGGLVMLRWRQRADATLVVLLVGAVMFVFTFGFNVFGVTVFLPGRWFGFLYVPLVIIAAVGLFHVASHAPRGVIVGVVLVFALGYPATMVMAEKATLDDPAFEDRYTRTSFSESELAAAETIPSVLTPATMDHVRTDHPYWRTFHPERSGGVVTHLIAPDGTPATDNPVVFREYQSTGPSSFHLDGEPPYEGTSARYERATVCPETRNYVYGNDDVLLCTTPGADDDASDGDERVLPAPDVVAPVVEVRSA